jgi:hypothetical protein
MESTSEGNTNKFQGSRYQGFIADDLEKIRCKTCGSFCFNGVPEKTMPSELCFTSWKQTTISRIPNPIRQSSLISDGSTAQ